MEKEHQARHFREEPVPAPKRSGPAHAAGRGRADNASRASDKADVGKRAVRVPTENTAPRRATHVNVARDNAADTVTYPGRSKPNAVSKVTEKAGSAVNKIKDKLNDPDNPPIERAKGFFRDFSWKRRWPVVAVAAMALVVLVFTIASAASSHVGNVKGLEVTGTTNDSVTLQWERVEHADGYNVYSRKTGDENYAQAGVVMEPNPPTYTVSKLDQASEYSFYVTAFNDKSKSGGHTAVDSVWTLPQKTDITTLSSDTEGVIHVEWLSNLSAAGFVIEYAKADTENAAYQQKWIDDGSISAADIEGVEPYITYNVRVAPYINTPDKLIGGMSDIKSVQVYMDIREVAYKPLDESIDPSRPMVAFTFDDGPLSGDSGERILDTLEQYGAKATFFMIGCNVADHADNLRRKVELGMELGNHTWNHKNYGEDVTAEDISKASDAIYSVTGQYPTAFRSPGGLTTEAIQRECAAEGMPLYYWTVDTRDWDSLDANEIYNETMNHVEDGAIILMHEIYDTTADALTRIVPALVQQGYQIVTCHDLMVAKGGITPEPGTQYYSAYR